MRPSAGPWLRLAQIPMSPRTEFIGLSLNNGTWRQHVCQCIVELSVETLGKLQLIFIP